MQIDELIQTHRVLVCCGSGGVGKTTTSAALALRAARLGKRAVVITIDPAKRLATSLGLKELSPSVADLSANVDRELDAESQPKLSGRFFAVMPDTQQTFERFVRTMAGANEGLAKRVLRTSIYKIFAKEFSGTNEYMAMEKLFELYSEKGYDLIVLDTPPSANTRTFLEAPRMLAEFFDDRIIKWFITPGSKLLATGLKKALEILEKLTGHGFISDLLEFTAALFELRAQFMENLTTVGKLLTQEDVAFLLVTSPERISKNDTQEFLKLLSERGYRFWGFVVNRMLGRRLGIQGAPTAKPAKEIRKWAEQVQENEATILKSNFELITPILEHEYDTHQFLKRAADSSTDTAPAVVLVAEQRSDVHSIGALLEICFELGGVR